MSAQTQRTADPARGGYYTVQDARGSSGREDYNVRGYDRSGNLLLWTWHVGDTSMHMECEAWERRGAQRRQFDPVKELKNVRQ